jgi:hypothetical protein
MRRLLLLVALALPATAAADGGPALPLQNGAGVRGAGANYVAARAGHDTLVERVRRSAVERSRLVRGSYGVAQGAFDTATGLSADGRVLVLQGLVTGRRYPPRRTRLLVLDRGLGVRARIILPGFFVVDAISPDGRWLYLLHYRGQHYAVRAYDLRARRLLRAPVVDPREAGEQMQGMPLTRVTGPGGRWVYTLYQRNVGAPFIHALDTVGRTARCIDLGVLGNEVTSTFGLRGLPGELEVTGGSWPVYVSTTTWTTSMPGPRLFGLDFTIPV